MARSEPSEWSEQCAVIAWARMNEGKYPCLHWLHASLNGVKLTLGQARKMKAAGMVAGVFDLCLPYPSGRYHGLWIEMKVGKNRLTPQQREFFVWLELNGYVAQTAYGFERAVAIIEEYLSLPSGENKNPIVINAGFVNQMTGDGK